MSPEASTIGGDQSVEDLRRELAEAREQQAATAGILAAMSKSPIDPYCVFVDIVASAARLCDANSSIVVQLADGKLWLLAGHGPLPTGPVGQPNLPFTRGSVVARAIIDKTTIHVADLLAETEEYPEGSELARRHGHRTIVVVPLSRAGEAIGAISVRRAEVRPFTERQIDLLKIFANQAVIAIENTRLFEAEQTTAKELQEALAYQMATSEVLRVISRSPTDVQQVYDVIVKRVAHLFPCYATVVTLEDGQLHWKATASAFTRHSENDIKTIRALYPLPFDPDHSPSCRAIRERRIIEIPDVATPDTPESTRKALQIGDYRSATFVPLMREGKGIGAIALAHRDPGFKLTGTQLALVQTFADQAVIAIENTRLIAAEQASTRELQESLEYQTAMSEVLGVISRSTFELQPVLEAVVESATRLCGAKRGHIFRFDGEYLRFAAAYGAWPGFTEYLETHPSRPGRGGASERAALEGRTIHIADVLLDSEYERVDLVSEQVYRTVLAVPMLRKGTLLGVIAILKTHVDPFTDKQIVLVETFADQAVIAIENARLFEAEQTGKRELQESLEYQTATSDVLGVISRSKFDLQPIIDTIVETAMRLCQAKIGALNRYEGGGFRLLPTTGTMPNPVTKGLLDRLVPIDRGSVAGRVAIERRTVHILDLQSDPEYTLMRGIEHDRRTCLGVPLIASNGLLGALVLQRTEVMPFTERQIKLVETFADQAVIAFENTRLFDEIVRKSRELEIASQHKSQFVANMSHELRTPLAAILGYAELMQEGFYGNQSEKSMAALTRIRSNGKHLLGLINTVLDIAKIESGQFTLNMTEYAIEGVIETVRSATESLAQNKNLALKTEVAKFLPIGLGDEQRLTQVLLNLVGNAIKFTARGEVRVTAKATNGHFNVSVTDTGPGIPDHERTRIFEQFHQVDSSLTKAAGGTGLGLAIAKQIVEMHGGRIWVESTVGKGSTFQMELPTRAGFRRSGP